MDCFGKLGAKDGPVLSVVNKRLRALRKKYNRILRMEESLLQGKTLNREQMEALDSKASVMGAIAELEKLVDPICDAVEKEVQEAVGNEFSMVEEIIKLLYFAVMFTAQGGSSLWEPGSLLSLEREWCLALNYGYGNEPDAITDMDLSMICKLGNLMVSRLQNSNFSHKHAVEFCIEQARLWLTKSDQSIGVNSYISYAGLREKLNKIMASDYFTATPEMRAPVEVAAAAGNYGSFQVPVHENMLPADIPGVEGSMLPYELSEQVTAGAVDNGTYDSPSDPVSDFQQVEEVEDFAEHQDETGRRDVHSREQQYVPRRSSHYRGSRGMSGGGRRGYPNGRGGRGSGRGGGYQNGGGRPQYYDQGGNYYPRNSNFRGRGGRGYGGNHNHHGGGQSGYAPVDS